MSKDKPRNDDQQKLVDEFFDANVVYWKDTYQARDIDGIIYQRRQAVALSYIDSLQLRKSVRVLEIGCGAGLMSTALARRGFFVEAIDHSQAMVQLTQKRARETGLENRINAHTGDVHSLSYPDRSFDLIVALGVIPWLHDFRKALTEIARVLSSEGNVVLSMDNELRATTLLDPLTFPMITRTRSLARSKLEKAGLLNSKNSRNNSPSYSRHTIRNFTKDLNDSGLTVQKSKSVGFGPFTFFNHRLFSDSIGIKIQEKLQHYADNEYLFFRSMGSQYIFLATKKST